MTGICSQNHLVSLSLALHGRGKRSDVGQEIHLSRGAATCSYGQKDRGLAQNTWKEEGLAALTAQIRTGYESLLCAAASLLWWFCAKLRSSRFIQLHVLAKIWLWLMNILASYRSGSYGLGFIYQKRRLKFGENFAADSVIRGLLAMPGHPWLA